MGLRVLTTVLCLGVFAGSLQAAQLSREDARSLFQRTDEALQAGENVDVEDVMARLDGYPLAPYLAYRALLSRLDEAGADEVLAFRAEHGHLPVTPILEHRWLLRAGARADWSGFERIDDGSAESTRITCYRLRARHAEGDVDAKWLDKARTLWTVGYSQPAACDPVFDVLYEREALSEARRWRRVSAAIKAGNTGLARAVGDRLTAEQRRWLGHWLDVAAAPAKHLADPGFDIETEYGRQIVRDGLRRLGRMDQSRAMTLLERYRERGALPESVLRSTQRYIALRAAFDRDDKALEWLDALPQAERDGYVREWTANAALSEQNWSRLRSAILELPPKLRSKPQWRYWRAVALARTGDPVTATEIFDELAGLRHYYGFLAADLLNRPYAMNHRPAPRDDATVAELAERPGLIRAHELYRLGYDRQARREWYAALSGADAETWGHAAHLALDWGWYGRTVHAANRAGLRDALELRFPLAFRDRVESFAKRSGVDAALAYALMRKESAFDPRAISRVGARGLMQLMPATARRVARDLGVAAPTSEQLLHPERNMRLGSAYLDKMLQRFDGSLIAAVAAYNAGPTRTAGWQEENAGLTGTLWVENITYGETRDYVKSVMAFRAVFDWRLHGVSRRLMPAMEHRGSDRVLAARELE